MKWDQHGVLVNLLLNFCDNCVAKLARHIMLVKGLLFSFLLSYIFSQLQFRAAKLAIVKKFFGLD